MSTTSTNSVDPVLQPILDFWSSFAKQANDGANHWVESWKNTADVQALRRRWSDAVSESLDAYLRSPAFMETMKHGLDAMINTRDKTNDVTKEVAYHANMPTTNDISGLFERLHSVETTILSRLTAIERRLNEQEVSKGGRAIRRDAKSDKS